MKPTLDELYEQLTKESTFRYDDNRQQGWEANRFKSILFPDYSDYTTTTITGNIC